MTLWLLLFSDGIYFPVLNPGQTVFVVVVVFFALAKMQCDECDIAPVLSLVLRDFTGFHSTSQNPAPPPREPARAGLLKDRSSHGSDKNVLAEVILDQPAPGSPGSWLQLQQ